MELLALLFGLGAGVVHDVISPPDRPAQPRPPKTPEQRAMLNAAADAERMRSDDDDYDPL